jgi:hypothetical protein
MKKLVSLLLVATLLMACVPVSLADDENPNIVKHVISVEVPSTVSQDQPIGGDDSDIWGTGNFAVSSGTPYSTLPFTIPDRYFAYEIRATGASTQTFTVSLFDIYGSFYASGSTYADGYSKVKVDWITVDAGESYQFKIYNNTGNILTVYITYYSWA